MLTKNQAITAQCDALGADFEGICRHEGQVVFVTGMLPGERARVKIIKAAKSYAVGRLEQLITFSPARQKPPCPYFARCGGCTAQHLDYAATLAHKRRQVVDCLERIGGIAAPDVAEVIGMDVPWRYRNKGAFPVGGRPSAPRIGIYAARSHDIVDVREGCLLQTRQSDALVAAVRRWMAACQVEPYGEETHRGLVRHVVTREAKDGAAMLVLVINGGAVPAPDTLVAMAAEAAPGLRAVILSENRARTNVILGERFHTLWGEDTLTDEIAGFAVRVSPRTFFQVNRPQAEALYQTALDFAALDGTQRVWDLYCGCGTITMPLAARAREAIGVEIVPDAIADARENARRNGVENARFIAGAAEAVLPALAREAGAPDVVVLDPPRKGCDPAAIETLLEVGAGRIVYVSCNPATLARDVGRLCAGGYALGPVQPVDMFGWTGHVEAVAVLTHGLSDSE